MKLTAETSAGRSIPHPAIVANETYLIRLNGLSHRTPVNPALEVEQMVRSARSGGPVGPTTDVFKYTR